LVFVMATAAAAVVAPVLLRNPLAVVSATAAAAVVAVVGVVGVTACQ
jgi:hypothetical protein